MAIEPKYSMLDKLCEKLADSLVHLEIPGLSVGHNCMNFGEAELRVYCQRRRDLRLIPESFEGYVIIKQAIGKVRPAS